ncbi:MAG: alpha-1,6-glucosidase domain-containing protein [Xanthomonadaceae bacterium]|nr:alpha-1,6-glucosidase domain-containing protein [Xanthomonadaceae bacterium]
MGRFAGPVRLVLVALAGFAPAAGAQEFAALCSAPDTTRLQVVEHADTPEHARAVWLNERTLRWPGVPAAGQFRLYHAASGRIAAPLGEPITGADGALALEPLVEPLPAATAVRFRHVADGVELTVAEADRSTLAELHRGQLILVREDAERRIIDATRTQTAAALDALYSEAFEAPGLGVSVADRHTGFGLWAPTARAVTLCLFEASEEGSATAHPLARDPETGIWRFTEPADLSGRYYVYLVDVFVPGTGRVVNRVTDPYAISLGADSLRGYIGRLDAEALKPPGWDNAPRPSAPAALTDMTIYELHVRDFSIGDASVSPPAQGRYAAFTETGSRGMRHLRALAEAGLTDLHLLPVFDIASVPERGCLTPEPSGPPDGEAQAELIEAHSAGDCFNWGYDPLHFTAPEGSYASDPSDGAVRVREFRAMVQALHGIGLRVGMDVVYNHTSAAGQHPASVLDRIVPGYYHRLDADGRVETSTCCPNTATEHVMMARLMIDSAVVWVRDYRIDGFRFDLMGHQPRAVMQALQRAVDRAAGRPVPLIGEGWNFGEVADGARFEQASQLSLPGSGIATFSDRARDAARGGGCCDGGADLIRLQGWLNGLHYAPNAEATGRHSRADLLAAADQIRIGLAGTLADYRMQSHTGHTVPLSAIDYAGQPAGYASQPGEVVNYVENHDNPTLFDINALRLPRETGAEDRARVQLLGAAIVAFSQGIAYYHAGIDTLRSKSLDRNSFDSGDAFNRLDWTYTENGFAVGLPPGEDNRPNWPWLRPVLADPDIAPAPGHIRWMRDAFRDLLRIRASSRLFRLPSAAEVSRRLALLDTGPDQIGSVLIGHLDGVGYPGAGFAELVYFINADVREHSLTLPELAGRDWRLHPVHRAAAAADTRPANQARVATETGQFRIPARTALVYVVE